MFAVKPLTVEPEALSVTSLFVHTPLVVPVGVTVGALGAGVVTFTVSVTTSDSRPVWFATALK